MWPRCAVACVVVASRVSSLSISLFCFASAPHSPSFAQIAARPMGGGCLDEAETVFELEEVRAAFAGNLFSLSTMLMVNMTETLPTSRRRRLCPAGGANKCAAQRPGGPGHPDAGPFGLSAASSSRPDRPGERFQVLQPLAYRSRRCRSHVRVVWPQAAASCGLGMQYSCV